MNSANPPIDIGKEQIDEHKDYIESKILTNLHFNSRTYALPDLLRKADPDEKYVMGNLERETYVAIREGLQIFNEVNQQLGKKIDLDSYHTSVPSSELDSDPKLLSMRGFCNNYATYAAATHISHRLEELLSRAEDVKTVEPADTSALRLNSSLSSKIVMDHLLKPLIAQLVPGKEDEPPAFSHASEIPQYAKDVFDGYAKLAKEKAYLYKQYEKNLEGYTFNLMDGFLELEGYSVLTAPRIELVHEQESFQRIQPEEIVGNRNAKRKITRYMDRLALYDVTEQMNPLLTLGGLSWTNLFDGLPGTGKTSMFRMAMTLLEMRAEQVGIPYRIFKVDQNIKDKYYGNTGQKLLERLKVAKDPNLLSIGIFDDIDLLTSNRNDAQGADNDVNNILMQFLDGAFTVRRGNVINFAASNEPTGLDNALRNRFSDRLLVDGPVTAEDFSDLFEILGGKMIDNGLIQIERGYTPFQTQDIRNEDGTWSLDDVSGYMADEFSKRYGKATVAEFGQFMYDLKQKNPTLTGRSTKAIVDAIKERAANFDIPGDWFENHSIFLDKPFAEKENILSELYVPITPDVLFQEAQRYFDSEQRYANEEAERAITQGYNNIMWETEAQIRALKDQLDNPENVVELAAYRARRELIMRKARETVIAAAEKAGEEPIEEFLQDVDAA